MNTEFILTVAMFGSLLFAMLAITIIAFMIMNKQRLRRYKQALEAQIFRHEKEMLHACVEAQEEILDMASGEIHDNIGQELTIALLQIGEAETCSVPQDAQRLMRQARLLIGRSVDDLRNLSHVMNQNMVKNDGLITSIEKILTYVRSLHKLQCYFAVSGVLPPLDGTQTLLLFRILQEAVLNVIKHARATILKIDLACRAKELELCIADNGSGMDIGNSGKQGLGLSNMKYLSGLLHGTLDIDSSPGSGCTLRVTVPAITAGTAGEEHGLPPRKHNRLY